MTDLASSGRQGAGLDRARVVAEVAAVADEVGLDRLTLAAGDAATVRAPEPGDEARAVAADAVLRVVFAILAGYGVTGEGAVDATRALRAALHGFVTLEAAGGFGMVREVDRSVDRFLVAFDAALGGWAEQTGA